MRSKTLFLAAVAVMSLTACESVDTAMSNIRHEVSSWNLNLPEMRSSDKTAPMNGEEEQNPPLTVVDRNLPEPAEPSARTAYVPADEMQSYEQMASAGAGPDPLMAATSTSDFVIDGRSGNSLVGEGCPAISVLEELNTLHQFADPDKPRPEEWISSAKISRFSAQCKQGTNNISADIELVFEAERGSHPQASGGPGYIYPYFIAVTTPNGNIVAKEVFAANVAFEPGSAITTHHENMRQLVPQSAEPYSLLVGFQLTEGQLAYNRALQGKNYVTTVSDAVVSSSKAAETPAPAKKAEAKKPPMKVVPSAKPEVPASAMQAEAAPAPAESAPVADEPAPVETAPLESAPPAEATAAAPAAEEGVTLEPVTTPVDPDAPQPPLPNSKDIAEDLSTTIEQEMPAPPAMPETATPETAMPEAAPETPAPTSASEQAAPIAEPPATGSAVIDITADD